MDLTHLVTELRTRFNVDSFKERRKRSRQKDKEDPFWVDSFHQIFVEKNSKERDDLLFIVRWDDKQNCESIEVFRRDTASLPSSCDETVLWEQTLYLNVILHEFEYHVTCGVVTVNDGIVDSVTNRVIQQVYPSPIQRRMDKKDSLSDVSYPNVMFYVDNFEEVFKDMCCNVPGEKVAVQLMATNKSAGLTQLVFLGAIDHTALNEAYEKKDETKSGFGSKLKMTLKSRSSRVFDLCGPYHFVRMRGPHSKGFAEVAVLKQDISSMKLQKSTSHSTVSGSSHFFGTSEASNGPPDESSSFQNHSDNSIIHMKGNEKTTGEDGNSDLSSTLSSLEAGGSFSKLKSLFYRKSEPPSEKGDSVSSSSGVKIYAYLTYLQLPWYSLVDDILNCTKDKAL